MEKYNSESKLEIFLNKINELEKGNNIENIELNMLNDDGNGKTNKRIGKIIKNTLIQIERKKY